MCTRRWLVLGILAASLLASRSSNPPSRFGGAVKQTTTLTPDDLAKDASCIGAHLEQWNANNV
jgi:hypothetical protein